MPDDILFRLGSIVSQPLLYQMKDMKKSELFVGKSLTYGGMQDICDMFKTPHEISACPD